MENKSLEELIAQYTEVPEWLKVDHPDFPKYFQVVVFDEKGNLKSWWQRMPDHCNGLNVDIFQK